MPVKIASKKLNDIANTYAIVDIETTGGSVSNSRITEIAILLHDGIKVIKRWSTLVNPEMPIPLHITALTGITDDMVANAPTFAELSQEVYDLLNDCIFVAHNVNFDYSFLRGQLSSSGLVWNATKLCTVRMSRKLIPGLPSYSLGKLCTAVNITLNDRHRALGDAEATAKLFTMLLKKDQENVINQMLSKTSAEQRLPPNLPEADFKALPEAIGVYYFHDKAGKVIYVGKAINLKKRVASHFTGNSASARRQHFLRDIYTISFELCGSELMALLLECAEIQRLWPTYNSALKRFEAKFALYHYVAVSGYSHLAVGKLPKLQQCIKTFDRELDALNFLAEMSGKFSIDQRFCRYGNTSARQSNEILPSRAIHNLNVNQMLTHIAADMPSFLILQQGRQPDEQGCIYVEKGKFSGMGYLSEEILHNEYEVKESLTSYKSNHYMSQLATGYAQRYPALVKWLINPETGN